MKSESAHCIEDHELIKAEAALVEYAKRHPRVLRVWLIGSRIYGLPRRDSDLDVVMELDPRTRPVDWSPSKTLPIEHEEFQSEIQPLIKFKLHHSHFYTRCYEPELQESVRKGRMIYEIERCVTSIEQSFI